MAAAVQRKAIEDELQRLTLRVTRRTVPIIFSMMLVQASERRNSAGRPSLLTVRISSNPSRMLFETPGASRSSRWARLRIYDTERSRPVAVVLRPGKTPSGVEVRAHLRRLVRHIRKRWTTTRITFRGDGHYARPEAMAWCENNGIDYIFGLSGTK